jgi:hypothetical protein
MAIATTPKIFMEIPVYHRLVRASREHYSGGNTDILTINPQSLLLLSPNTSHRGSRWERGEEDEDLPPPRLQQAMQGH